MEVVDFVGSTADSTDHLIYVIELTFRAFSTVVVDQVVSGFADASVADPIFVD